MSDKPHLTPPTFLIVRQAPGSAGNFLISLLQCSTSMLHNNSKVETNKTNNSCLSFFKEHYTNDTYHWLLNEPRPQNSLNLHFISASYSRGDDLTFDAFMNLCREEATLSFWQGVHNNKLIPMIWCKPTIPNFFINPKIVTIIIDNKAVKWFHRAVWYKRYGIKDGKIHIKADDPLFNPYRSNYINKFKNPYLVDENPIGFIKKNIINNKLKRTFMDIDNFLKLPNQEFVNLSELLDEDLLVVAINRICTNLNLNPVSESLIRSAHQHWSSCHEF